MDKAPKRFNKCKQQKLYPSTKRFGGKEKHVITEKMDGSNLMFFKLDGELFVGKRSSFAKVQHVMESDFGIKGLKGWLEIHGEDLKNSLNEGSVICGEWLAMGRLKYPFTEKKRFHMFAKANFKFNTQKEVYNEETQKVEKATKKVDQIIELQNILYKHELFGFCFEDGEIPEFINVVPVIAELDNMPTLAELNVLYERYVNEVDRHVEGFIIMGNATQITKYVRNKNGYIEEHFYKVGK